MKKIVIIVLTCLLPILSVFSQRKDNSKFKEYAPGYYQNVILKDIRNVEDKQEPAEADKRFEVDMSGMDIPNKLNLYKNIQWHTPPISQGNAGT